MLTVTAAWSLAAVVPQAHGQLLADTRYERPSSGYEGTYEWRGVSAFTYVYPWDVDNFGYGEHVSSIFIHHPFPATNLRHMEIGIDKYYYSGARVFIQWVEVPQPADASDWHAEDLDFVTYNSSQKLLIRNITMGDVNTGWQHWIMSWNDQIVYSRTHPLTYGQAWSSSETAYRGDDNRAYFSVLKRTSRPANWKDWTASSVKYDQDPYYRFRTIGNARWYNE